MKPVMAPRNTILPGMQRVITFIIVNPKQTFKLTNDLKNLHKAFSDILFRYVMHNNVSISK